MMGINFCCTMFIVCKNRQVFYEKGVSSDKRHPVYMRVIFILASDTV